MKETTGMMWISGTRADCKIFDGCIVWEQYSTELVN